MYFVITSARSFPWGVQQVFKSVGAKHRKFKVATGKLRERIELVESV